MNTAIILSGGVGSRMGADTPKQYIKVQGRPIISYCAETFAANPEIDAIVIGAEPTWVPFIEEALKSLHIKQPVSFSAPGETRQHSIYNALKHIAEHHICANNDVVIIHDAARPLVSQEIISSCIHDIVGYDGVLPVIRVKDTVYHSVDGQNITSLLNRSELFAGQAPEAFYFGAYKRIHDAMTYAEICQINGSTEIAYKCGLNVRLVAGSDMNFKITTPEDLTNFESIVTKLTNDESI